MKNISNQNEEAEVDFNICDFDIEINDTIKKVENLEDLKNDKVIDNVEFLNKLKSNINNIDNNNINDGTDNINTDQIGLKLENNNDNLDKKEVKLKKKIQKKKDINILSNHDLELMKQFGFCDFKTTKNKKHNSYRTEGNFIKNKSINYFLKKEYKIDNK